MSNPTRIDGGNGAPAKPAPVQILITFDPSTGDVKVDGAIADPILFFGMLKLAELAFTSGQRVDRDKRIVPASVVPLKPPTR